MTGNEKRAVLLAQPMNNYYTQNTLFMPGLHYTFILLCKDLHISSMA